MSDATDQVYEHRILPDLLDGVPASPKPTAVLIAGQPGAGTGYASALVQRHLAASVGPSVLLSGERLRRYLFAAGDGTSVRDWFARALQDAVARRANLVVQSGLSDPRAATAFANRLRDDGYEVAAVALAIDRDESRQAWLAHFDQARSIGLAPSPPDPARHKTAYDNVRTALALMESQAAVDRIQVVVRDGRELYANQVLEGAWARPPKAVEVLDDFRERRRTARELADSALRWHTLAQRLGNDPSLGAGLAAQVLAWREEATQRAEADPEARQFLAWGREAEAFRKMSRFRFREQFPHHAKAVERLQEAIDYAEKTFEQSVDRLRFVEQAKQRLAERIAEGRLTTPERTRKTTGRTR